MTSLPEVVVLSGCAGAGKTTVAQLLLASGASSRLDVAALLRDVLLAEGQAPRSRADIGPMFLQGHGAEDVYALIAPHLENASHLVVDAVRLEDTARRLLMHDGLQIWHVDAPRETRLRHLRARLRAEGLSGEEVELGLVRYETYNGEQEAIRRLARVVIDNVGSLSELRHRVSEALEAEPRARD